MELAEETSVKSQAGLYSSLRRITTSEGYIPEIDGLRFIAILSVVCSHVPAQIPLEALRKSWIFNPISKGSRGVGLFFVISGFILALPFALNLLRGKPAVSLRRYFLRRVTRLEPPYILTILIRLPLLILVMHKPLHFVLVHGMASLFYVHSLVYGAPSAINPPAWSLEVEIQFYCLAPLLAISYFRLHPTWLRRAFALSFIVLAGVLQERWILPNSARLSLSILNYLQYFFAGFVLCDVYLVGWERIPRHWMWDVLATPIWCWIFLASNRSSHLLLPFAALVVYLAAFKGKVYSSIVGAPWIALIGGMCYSIYLTHNLVITAIDQTLALKLHTPNVSSVIMAYGVTLPIALMVGMAMYVCVERPCMDKDWPRKFWHWFLQRTERRAATEAGVDCST